MELELCNGHDRVLGFAQIKIPDVLADGGMKLPGLRSPHVLSEALTKLFVIIWLAKELAYIHTFMFFICCARTLCAAHMLALNTDTHIISHVHHLWVYACLIHSKTMDINVVHVPLPTSDPGMDPGRVLTASDPPLSTGALISNRWRGDRRLVLKNAAGHSLADVEVSIQGLRSLALVT